jgi:hypothetical protein
VTVVLLMHPTACTIGMKVQPTTATLGGMWIGLPTHEMMVVCLPLTILLSLLPKVGLDLLRPSREIHPDLLPIYVLAIRRVDLLPPPLRCTPLVVVSMSVDNLFLITFNNVHPLVMPMMMVLFIYSYLHIY